VGSLLPWFAEGVGERQRSPAPAMRASAPLPRRSRDLKEAECRKACADDDEGRGGVGSWENVAAPRARKHGKDAKAQVPDSRLHVARLYLLGGPQARLGAVPPLRESAFTGNAMGIL